MGIENSGVSAKKGGKGANGSRFIALCCAAVTAAAVIMSAFALAGCGPTPGTPDPPTEYTGGGTGITETEPGDGDTGSGTTDDTIPDFSKLSLGDHCYFGSYLQNTSKPEPIEWRVLAVERGKLLLITEKLIDCQKYNSTNSATTWSECSLRQWLNFDFMDEAFTSEQQKYILYTENSNPGNSSNSKHTTVSGGSSTNDFIFCLSMEEAKRYFDGKTDRMAAPTGYARQNGVLTREDAFLPSREQTGWWWLRSPGFESSNAAIIYNTGVVHADGADVDAKNIGVRPAMWVSAE